MSKNLEGVIRTLASSPAVARSFEQDPSRTLERLGEDLTPEETKLLATLELGEVRALANVMEKAEKLDLGVLEGRGYIIY